MLRNSARVLLAAHGALFAWLTLAMFAGDHPPPNLVPLRSILHDWRVGGRDLIVNFACNIGIFLPIGFLLPLACRGPTRTLQVAASCLAFSALIEGLQYLSGRRVADVDDVLLNTIGGLLGYLALRSMRGRGRANRESA